MDPEPPDPHCPPDLVVLLARLAFVASGRAADTGEPIGVFVDPARPFVGHVLVASRGVASGEAVWALAAVGASRSAVPCLVTAETAKLTEGTPDGRGGIELDGVTWRVQLVFDGERCLARAVRA